MVLRDKLVEKMIELNLHRDRREDRNRQTKINKLMFKITALPQRARKLRTDFGFYLTHSWEMEIGDVKFKI